MRLGQASLAPRGYLQFCVRRPDQCGMRTPLMQIRTEAMQAALNREEWTNVLSTGRSPAPSPVAPPPAERPVRLLMASYGPAYGPDYRPLPVAPSAAPQEISLNGAPIEGQPAQPGPEAAPAVVAVAAVTPAPRLDDLFQEVRRSEATVLHYTPELWRHLENVNAEINALIKPRTDVEAFGIDDYWTLPLEDGGKAEGNCKHYALEKRRVLTEGGMSEDALSLAIVRTPRGETHAVLIVATDRGDFVLDNLNREIVGWRDTGYAWLSRQTPGSPLRWAAVDLNGRVGG